MSNTERLLKDAGVDYDEALDRFGGNIALYKRLAVKYLDDTHAEGVKTALANNTCEDAYSHAHALKGVSGNLSLTTLHQLSSSICIALKEGDLDLANEAVSKLIQADEVAKYAFGKLL